MNDLFYKYLPQERTGFYKENNKTVQGFFTELELVATRPKDLNDPFECAINIDYTFTLEELKNRESAKSIKAREYAEEYNVKKSKAYKIINARFKKLRNDEVYRNTESKRIYDDYLKKTNNDFRIVSFSKNKKSLLMWAHYASEHKGIVVGFNFSEDCNHILKPREYFCSPKRVKYVEELPKLEFNSDGNPIINKYFHRFKSKEWEYEEEFRILYPCREYEHNRDCIKLQFASSSISEIIFGARMNESDKINIMEYCKKNSNLHHLKFFQSKISRTHYKLDFEEIKTTS